jgi:myo-inositol-1(or 4)-monophosphatase
MSFDQRQLAELAGEARQVAEEAGLLLAAGLGSSSVQVEHKGLVDLVTDYDRRAEELIRDRLERRFPEIGILAEEKGGIDRGTGDVRWIVDPLDGTTNFAHGHPLFAVSIGLEERGELVVGTVVVPVLETTYVAHRGGQTTRNNVPVRVSAESDLGAALLATGFPYDRRTAEENNTRELAAFVRRAQGVRRMGAAAIDLALVASGVYDGFWEPKLGPWDLAAGTVLVRQAGGLVTDYDGAPVDIHCGWVVASNQAIHAQLLEVLLDSARD